MSCWRHPSFCKFQNSLHWYYKIIDCYSQLLETLLPIPKQIVISVRFFACLASLIYNGTWNSPKIWRQLALLWPSTTSSLSSMMWQRCPLLYSHKSSYSSFVQSVNWSATARQHCSNSSHPSTTMLLHTIASADDIILWNTNIFKQSMSLFCVKTGDGSIYISI